jgi:hypothetical protein
MVGGAIEIITIISSSTFLRFKPEWRSYIGALYYIPWCDPSYQAPHCTG